MVVDPGKPFRLSVKALVRNPAGQYLLIRRSGASKHNKGMWDFPGGKVDSGEMFDEALRREIREETGLDVTLSNVAGAAESELPAHNVVYVIMEARADSSSVTLSSEHDAFQWAEPGQIARINICSQFRDFADHFFHAKT